MDIDKLVKENPPPEGHDWQFFSFGNLWARCNNCNQSLFLRDGWHSMKEEAPLIDCKTRQEINTMNKALK